VCAHALVARLIAGRLLLELQRLRAEAEQALGARVDLRAFHEIVVRDGAVPLAMVSVRVERSVRDQRGTIGQ